MRSLMDAMALHCTLRFDTIHNDTALMGFSEEVGSSEGDESEELDQYFAQYPQLREPLS